MQGRSQGFPLTGNAPLEERNLFILLHVPRWRNEHVRSEAGMGVWRGKGN